MKTTQSDIIVVIGGNVETSKTAPPNAFVLLKAKLHYAVQLTSRSQTSSRPNSITLFNFRPDR